MAIFDEEGEGELLNITDWTDWSEFGVRNVGRESVVFSVLVPIEVDGVYRPWPIEVRSFIVGNQTAMIFGADERITSEDPSFGVLTSRVRTEFVIDPVLGTQKPAATLTDPTKLYWADVFGNELGSQVSPAGLLPDAKNNVFSCQIKEGVSIVSFSHEGKDPWTPEIATASLDLNGKFVINESNDQLEIIGVFTGDRFPSSEAIITDQKGKRLLLGACRQEGGLTDLFGEKQHTLFEIEMIVKLDVDGGFLSIISDGVSYSVKEWNDYIKEQF